MFPRLSFSSAGLLIVVLAAAVGQASTSLFSHGELACPIGYGEANCSLLSNGDLWCSVDKNSTRCESANNEAGLAYCTIRWEVRLKADGGVSFVTFGAYRETLTIGRVLLLISQVRLRYNCDDSGPYRSIVTTRCNTASCCERAEVTIPKLCLYRRITQPKPVCYDCMGILECNPMDPACNLSSDALSACSKRANAYSATGCTFTVLLWSTGEVTFHASNNAKLTEEDGKYCVASSYFIGSGFTAISCYCRGDACNSGIMFKRNSADRPQIDNFLAVTPQNNCG